MSKDTELDRRETQYFWVKIFQWTGSDWLWNMRDLAIFVRKKTFQVLGILKTMIHSLTFTKDYKQLTLVNR
jgi:hypothetical protein